MRRVHSNALRGRLVDEARGSVGFGLPGRAALRCRQPLVDEAEFPEWEWIRAHEAWLRENYAGSWIIVEGTVLVGRAGTPAEALGQARHETRPFLYHVPTDDETATALAL